MGKTWAADLNADLKGNGEALKEETGVGHDMELKGDVAKIGDFLAAKWLFGRGQKDPSKLVYSISTGEGFFSATLLAEKRRSFSLLLRSKIIFLI